MFVFFRFFFFFFGSAGKTFSVTGWKIGWVVAPKHLSTPVMLANNWIQFSVATPLQVALLHLRPVFHSSHIPPPPFVCAKDAVAQALVLAKEPYKGFPTYYDWLRDMYRSKRDRLLGWAPSHVLLSPLVGLWDSVSCAQFV